MAGSFGGKALTLVSLFGADEHALCRAARLESLGNARDPVAEITRGAGKRASFGLAEFISSAIPLSGNIAAAALSERRHAYRASCGAFRAVAESGPKRGELTHATPRRQNDVRVLCCE